MIFNVFSKIEIKIVIQLNLSSYTAIIDAIQKAVIGSLPWKTEKWISSEANQNKIMFSCRILQISIVRISGRGRKSRARDVLRF